MSDDQRPGILFLEALATIAGGQTVLVNLIPALRQHYRLAALLPGEGPLAAALRAEGVACFFAPVGRYSLMRKSLRDVVAYAARTPRLTWRTARLIRRWGADLVYANSGPTFLWGALAAQFTGRPIIWHHHNLLADGRTLAIVRTAARMPVVRTIICASPAAQEQFAVVCDKTVMIPNGVDTERFRPDLTARTHIRQEMGIAAAAPVVGMAGDLIPLKHQDTLLAALPLLLAKVPDVWIILVGDVRSGDEDSVRYAERLRRMASDHIIFLGRRSDLPALLNAFDVLVVASERETGPLVLLEALATGILVLSTPVGRSPELLPADMLFPTGDANALNISLARWLHDGARRSAMSIQLRHQAVQSLSLQHFHAAVQTVIVDILV